MKYLALVALTLCGVASPAVAAEPWVAAGDTRVRHDVQLLVDGGVIELPMSAWPIPAADLAAALAKARPSPRPSPAKGEGVIFFLMIRILSTFPSLEGRVKE